MKTLGVVCLILGGLGVAEAADPAQLFGKWIEKFANGNGMVTEFSATSVSSYPIDREGQASGPPRPAKVTYRDVDAGTVLLDFGDGTGILVHIQDAESIVLDFPGMGSHRLVRLLPSANGSAQ